MPDVDPQYLDYIRSLPCCSCGLPAPSVPHHQPAVGQGSMGMKCSDYRCVPLCVVCHDRLHRGGRLSFWGDVDPDVVILRLVASFFFA